MEGNQRQSKQNKTEINARNAEEFRKKAINSEKIQIN